MSHINFVIPQSKSELLSDNDVQYYVRNVISVKEIQPRLREARQCFKDEGPEYIIDCFDIYYSIIHHAEQLQLETIMHVFEDLQKAVKVLNDNINFILEDKDNLNNEFNAKYINVIKMLIYLYTNIVFLIEQKMETKRSQTLQKGRSRKKLQMDDTYGDYDKKLVLISLTNIIQREINIFWDPPVVEEMLINLIAEICYRFLENPTIKTDKELCTELFSTLGTLIKSYSHGVTFVIRIVQLIKIHEHLNHCVPDGIHNLVTNYNCKSLITDFVREITEWQTDEKFQDVQGSRNCSAVLVGMSNVMPELMIPEVIYLHNYLHEDSYTLRNSVLHVITEIVLHVLTKPNLSETERESRDMFLSYLTEHTMDTSALVRSKVFQHWSRLQQENAIPLKIQADVLERAVCHLKDRAANVRKAAANCVNTFLSYNIYGSKLQLDGMRAELEQKQKELNVLKSQLEDSHVIKTKELVEQFQSKEDKLREVVLKELEAGHGFDDDGSEGEVNKEHLPDLVRLYILEDKFKEVFEMCNKGGTLPEWENMKENLEKDKLADMFVTLIRVIFTDVSFDKGTGTTASEDDLNQLLALENSVEYLSNAAGFMALIDSAIKTMIDLLESTSISDMQEAVEFFVNAYKFEINNAVLGILEMIKIMQRNEQERKNHVIEAFKRIYLVTDSTSMQEHTTVIVDSLIDLLKMIPYENYEDMCLIISEWVSKSILDNAIIDRLWQYFTKRVEVRDEQARAALILLTMATMGRRTIGSKNIKLVATVIFGQRGKDDILLLKAGCEFLQAAAKEKQDITSTKPPFRIKATDPMWTELIDLVVDHFKTDNCYYNGMISSAIGCIYRLCSKPEKVCENLVETIVNYLATDLSNSPDLNTYSIMQISHILGEVALKQLNFLDESVYKELKRRNYIREERKCSSKNKKVNVSQVQNASASRRVNNSNSTNQSRLENDSVTTNADESTLEGAQADDTDAEFILNVLENNTVSESSGLGKLAYILLHICQSPQYDDVHIQGTAVTALLRYMLVSSKFCQKNMQLVFTILEKTSYPEVKANIIIHFSDILERFPNIVEPWTPRIYERLRDSCVDVRITTFFILANLILRDMIRVQGHISEMASCIVDDEEQLRDMSKNFFTQLSHKGNNLYNVLPDIFSRLCDSKSLSEENVKFIMKFLFGLIDKNKQMENLVERFCGKFRLTEDEYICRNIAYCLTLIQYNEKGLKNLSESFGSYKNILQNDDVYAFFKQILTTCQRSTKNEIKALALELEEKINAGFETNEEGQQAGTGSAQKEPKSAFKKPRGRAPPKRAKKKKVASDSDESDDEGAPAKDNRRSARKARRKIIDDDSD